MEKRALGKSGINVSPFCFGGNVFGWTVDEKQSFGILDAYVDSGLEFIDTADVYSKWKPGNKGGESETIIGNWLKQSGKRDRVIIATKVGKPMGENKKGLSKAYITQAVEDSLTRLKTDYIDLYQSHEDDPNISLEETLSTFTDLIKQGKVRAIGASNFSAARLQEALKVSQANGFARYETLQPEYNLYDRQEYENEYESICLNNNLGVITFYSLASGFLSGKYRSEADLSKSARGGGVKKYLNDRGFKILDALEQVASKYQTTPAAVAIAWVIAHKGITAPIASATSLKQLEDITAAVRLNLDQAATDLLTEASRY
ncbi:aldo/keto reductase [Mucilaginibacter panaciglaebae]|uniref:Aldo/keto reductase n=1 Tax=Mucilaginibacter panaciglaebae TaxID=502331 RepID=A0ABP7WFE7_9SPHI